MTSSTPRSEAPSRPAAAASEATTGTSGTPLYDDLLAAARAATHVGDIDGDPTHELPESPAGHDSAHMTSAAVLSLLTRIKDIEDADGSWNGGDVVQELSLWFGEFGIDVEAEPALAVQTLRLPTWLPAWGTELAITPHQGAFIIQLRADHAAPRELVRAHLRALLAELGDHATATVFDDDRHEIAHFGQATAGPGTR